MLFGSLEFVFGFLPITLLIYHGLRNRGWQIADHPSGDQLLHFQQIAYPVETWRGQKPASSVLDYMLFVLFFPHLIAGPITHHTEMLPQFARAGRGRLPSAFIAMGTTILVLGVAKKVLLADTVAQFADPVFAAAAKGEAVAMADAWTGALAYTLQLYFDFSGYSDIAIGIGLLSGIRFPVNFNSPYKATSIVDFWRRWHISLSAFLRTYLYIPLGGDRAGKARRYFNLMATMMLGGLWHGAGWTFLFWGFLQGFYLIVNHAWSALAADRLQLPRPLAWALTMLGVVVAWVVFRAASFGSAVDRLMAMAFGDAGGTPEGLLGWLLIVTAALIAVTQPNVLELARYPQSRLLHTNL